MPQGPFCYRAVKLVKTRQRDQQSGTHAIPKSVLLRLDLKENDSPFDCRDASQLQQVIMNLVINGAEAVPSGETGTVLVEKTSCKP